MTAFIDKNKGYTVDIEHAQQVKRVFDIILGGYDFMEQLESISKTSEPISIEDKFLTEGDYQKYTSKKQVPRFIPGVTSKKFPFPFNRPEIKVFGGKSTRKHRNRRSTKPTQSDRINKTNRRRIRKTRKY
jgi:hypothetical protein